PTFSCSTCWLLMQPVSKKNAITTWHAAKPALRERFTIKVVTPMGACMARIFARSCRKIFQTSRTEPDFHRKLSQYYQASLRRHSSLASYPGNGAALKSREMPVSCLEYLSPLCR